MDNILEKLRGGDRRSIGKANEVVADVLEDPSLFGAVFKGILDNDPIIRMRSADAVEKITAERPEYLQPYKRVLMDQVAPIEQQEVRWHVAQMILRLELSEEDLGQAAEILWGYLDDRSKIVKASTMQALAELAERDNRLLPQVVESLEELTRIGSPAVRSRGRKPLARLRLTRCLCRGRSLCLPSGGKSPAARRRPPVSG